MSETTSNKNVFFVGLSLAAFLAAIAAFTTGTDDAVVTPPSVETVKAIQAISSEDDAQIEEVIVIGDPDAEITENTNED